ncbi:MAG: DUF1464 family protein [Isosphaeraceae bacterium]
MSPSKPTILVQLVTDSQPSVFDAVVAVDARVQHIVRHGGVTPENVRDLVYGTIFTRGPADLNHTVIFIGGSNVPAGEAILDVIKKTFFVPFRVSVLFDGNGPIGLRSRGAWDGEVAYWRCPLSKQDLFRGGLEDLGPLGPDAFRESLARHLAGLRAVTPFERIYLSGAGLNRPDVARLTGEALSPFGQLASLPSLPGAWVKHAAQGSALLADALAGGEFAAVAGSLELRSAKGSIWEVVNRQTT